MRDAHLEGTLIPWSAISSIKASRSKRKGGGVLFLMTDASRLTTVPGPLATRLANLVTGVRPGQADKQMLLPMTPFAILDAAPDDVLAAIRAPRAGCGDPGRRGRMNAL